MLLLLELPVFLSLHSPCAGYLESRTFLLNFLSFLSFSDRNLLVGKAGLVSSPSLVSLVLESQACVTSPSSGISI